MQSLREDIDYDAEKEYLDERKRVAVEMVQARTTKILTYFAEKAKKTDFLSQIIYELDSNYDISPVLKELLEC